MQIDDARARTPRMESPLRVVALMVLAIALLGVLGVLGLLPLFILSQPCPIALQPCDTTSPGVVAVLMFLVPGIATVAGVVAAAVQLARGRRAIRWLAIACAVSVASWLVGLAVGFVAAS